MIKIKRIYEPAQPADGFRILVDRLWPRGIKKTEANIDVWLKEVAPSAKLRKWFNHEPEKWTAFKKAYLEELKKSGITEELTGYVKKHKHTTLLYAAKDEEHNQALVLQHYLQTRLD